MTWRGMLMASVIVCTKTELMILKELVLFTNTAIFSRVPSPVWDVNRLVARCGWRSMVKHQPLQVYEKQVFVSFVTGIYGCRWKRYQRSQDDSSRVRQKIILEYDIYNYIQYCLLVILIKHSSNFSLIFVLEPCCITVVPLLLCMLKYLGSLLSV